MDSFLEVLCPDCVVEEITVGEQMLVVKAHRVRHIAVCPDCGQESGRIHSYYDRKPQDLPIGGCYVHLSLTTRRFRCLNEQCQRRTFAESWGGWLNRYAHKTSRMKDALYHVAQAAGGQGGARLLQQLKMVASGTTLIRLLRAQVIPQITTTRVIGIDDWAIRRGRTYGTMIVDLEKREVVDLLPDRTAETVASWLESHPEVEIVARDRSSEYARGITMGAPQAQQLADRWHLLLNMCQMLERYMRQSSRRLKKLPPMLSENGELAISQREPFIRTEKDWRASQEGRARRVELYEEIQRRRQASESILGISKELSLHRETVRTFYYAEQYPDRTRKAQSSMLDEFIPHLEKRWAEGCENARELWREIQALGFKGCYVTVNRWLRPKRRNISSATTFKARETLHWVHERPQHQGALPSAKKLAMLICLPPDKLDDDESAIINHLLKDAQLAELYPIVQSYQLMIREKQVEALDSWLQSCQTSQVSRLKNFAQGIKDDYEVVKAALLMPWSSGQTEGQINRLKLLKRQMFGRAKLDLIKQRVLYAS